MNTPVSFELDKLLINKGIDVPVNVTIADVVMWLYKKHGIWISVDWMTRNKPYNSGFYCYLRGTTKFLNSVDWMTRFDSPTEAYEAAIEHCLTNII